MANDTIKATSRDQTIEIVLRTDGGKLPPLVQPASPEEQTAYQQAGAAMAKGSYDEAKQILEKAGFTVSAD